jgi:hypothetical protein
MQKSKSIHKNKRRVSARQFNTKCKNPKSSPEQKVSPSADNFENNYPLPTNKPLEFTDEPSIIIESGTQGA